MAPPTDLSKWQGRAGVGAEVGPAKVAHEGFKEEESAVVTERKLALMQSAVPEPVQLREGEFLAKALNVVTNVEDQTALATPVLRAP